MREWIDFQLWYVCVLFLLSNAIGALVVLLVRKSVSRRVEEIGRRVAEIAGKGQFAAAAGAAQESRELAELVRRLVTRVDGLGRTLDQLSRQQEPRQPGIQPPAVLGGGDTTDQFFLGASEHAPVALPAPPPSVARRPVDLESESVVPSNSLAAVGLLMIGLAGGYAELLINDQVDIDHYAFAKWQAAFDFSGGAAYRRYRTLRPAQVEWDAVANRGRITKPGVAEAI